MKKTTKYWGLALLTATLASCSADEPMTYATDPDALKITVNVGSLSSRTTPLGDEDSQRKFDTGDAISVHDGFQEIIYTFDGNQWVPTDGKYLRYRNTTLNAFFPADGKNTFAKGYTIADQSNIADISKADYMRCTTLVDGAGDGTKTVNLTMERQMARVILSVDKFNDGIEEDDHLVEYLKIYAPPYMEDGNYSGDMLEIAPYVQGDGSVGTTYTALIPPTGDSSPSYVTFACGYDDYKIDPLPAVESGKSYNFHMIIGKERVTIASVTVSDWTDGDVIEVTPTLKDPGYRIENGKYIIYDDFGLYNLAYKVNRGDFDGESPYFLLDQDIDLSAYYNWTPIGTDEHPFTGTFDGDGNSVTSLTINEAFESRPDKPVAIGLFGVVKNATIKNTRLSGEIYLDNIGYGTNNNVDCVGSLVGAVADGTTTIYACHSDALIFVSSVKGDMNLGGLVGATRGTSPTLLLYGNFFTGRIVNFGWQFYTRNNGLVGWFDTSNPDSIIISCYINASFSSPYRVSPFIQDGYNVKYAHWCRYSTLAGNTGIYDDGDDATIGDRWVADDGWTDAIEYMNDGLKQYCPSEVATIEYSTGANPYEVPAVITVTYSDGSTVTVK